MKVYISGPISGCPNGNRSMFYKLASMISKIHHVSGVVNPHELHEDAKDLSWIGYMRRDIKAMVECDQVFLLEGWLWSRGARLEYRLAKKLGITITAPPFWLALSRRPWSKKNSQQEVQA